MKNRDELAEAFAVALLSGAGAGYRVPPETAAKDAFAMADAFVAERDRRAVAVERPATGAALCGNTHRVRSGEDVLCDMPLDHDGDWHGAESDAESYGKPGRFRWHSGGPNGSESWTAAAPLAPENPAPKALWFGQDGRLLLGEDNPARWYEDGAEARAFQQVAHISIAATSRAHAERIVAAALAAGRAVES